LQSIAVYGGVDMDKQLKLLRRGVDIVIATPGRLLDHLQRGSINLQSIQVLVLDEADRMLDMGFIHDVRKIIAAVPDKRQTMLFSATMPDEIASLAADILQDPETVEVGERTNPVDTIEQHFYTIGQEAKTALLLHALEHEHMESVLVFARTKHGADKIARRLDRGGVSTTAIHSNRTQGQRDRALEAFKEGSIRVLVATDIAARGLDVSGISHVVNYDIPHQPEDYIHRIGRTGRAGAEGDAITFVAREDQQFLQRIERFTGKRVQVKSYPEFVPPPSQTAAQMLSGTHAQRGSQMHPARHQPTGSHQGSDSHSYRGSQVRSESPMRDGNHGRAPSRATNAPHSQDTKQGHPASRVHNTSQTHQASHGQTGSRGQSAGHPYKAMHAQRPSQVQSGSPRHGAPQSIGGRPGQSPHGSSATRGRGPSTTFKKKSSAPPWQKQGAQKKKRSPMVAVRKKSPPKKLDSFSSHSGGAGWSNY
jgi:ATP-dependent RNA helicase RhlE